jgi:hypothetical protein
VHGLTEGVSGRQVLMAVCVGLAGGHVSGCAFSAPARRQWSLLVCTVHLPVTIVAVSALTAEDVI